MSDDIASELLDTPVVIPAEPDPTPEAESQTEVEAVAELDTPEVEATGEENTVEVETPETAETDTPPVSEPETVLMSAHIGQRKDLQSQITDLKAQIASQPVAEKEKIDFFSDPDAAMSDFKAGLSLELTNTLLQEGQAQAERKYDAETVAEAVEWVTNAGANSPYIAQQFTNTSLLQQHTKAVEMYQQEKARAELGDPAKLKASMREEVKMELIAERKTAQEKKQALADSIPETLVGDTSQGVLSSSDWEGPSSIESLIDN